MTYEKELAIIFQIIILRGGQYRIEYPCFYFRSFRLFTSIADENVIVDGPFLWQVADYVL